jgi:hypothetical protein
MPIQTLNGNNALINSTANMTLPVAQAVSGISAQSYLAPGADAFSMSRETSGLMSGFPVGTAAQPSAGMLAQMTQFFSSIMTMFQQLLNVNQEKQNGIQGNDGNGVDALDGNNNDAQGKDKVNGNAATEVKQATGAGSSIKGLDPVASDALRKAGFSEDDVSQGLGNAPASKGTHLAEPGSKYTAAVDLRTSGKSKQEINAMVERLRAQGFAAWYRDWSGNEHIHAVYAGIPLKDSLQSQVQSFMQGGTGLAGGGNDGTITAQDKSTVESLYKQRQNKVAVA